MFELNPSKNVNQIKEAKVWKKSFTNLEEDKGAMVRRLDFDASPHPAQQGKAW